MKIDGVIKKTVLKIIFADKFIYKDLYGCTYMCFCVCVCVCMYIYIYIYPLA